MLDILIQCIYMTLQMSRIVQPGGQKLVPYYADILEVILPSMSNKDERMGQVNLFTCFPNFQFI